MALRRSFAADSSRCCPAIRSSRAKQAVMVRCQADFKKYKAQLASAAAPCMLAFTLTLHVPSKADAAQPTGLMRGDHKVTVSRSVLENMLLQQMNGRLHTLSDEELLYLLDQAQNASFPSQLLFPGTSGKNIQEPGRSVAPSPTAEPEPMPQILSPLESAKQGKQGTSRDRGSGMPRQLKQMPAEQSASDTQPLSEEPAMKQKPMDTAAESMTAPAAASDSAAAEPSASSVDDWRFKLQAFAKPLMQQMQGQQSQLQQPSTTAAADSSAARAQAPSILPSQTPADPYSSFQNQQQQQQSQPASQAPADSSDGSQISMLNSESGSDVNNLRQEAQPEGTVNTSGISSRQQDGARQPDDGAVSRNARQEASAQDQSASSRGADGTGTSSPASFDETEDKTGTMLQSSGVALPATIADLGRQDVGRGTQDQTTGGTGLSPVVLAYLGASWQRALPQLTLLAGAATASTLAVLAAQAAALKTAQTLQGSSASTPPTSDASSTVRPDGMTTVRPDATITFRPDASTAARPDVSDSADSAPLNVGGPSAFLPRLWQSAKRSLQPVLGTGWQKLWKQQGKTNGVSEQQGVPPGSSGESAMQGNQHRQVVSTQSPWQDPPHAEHDEWGRLVLHVNGSKSNANGLNSRAHQQSPHTVAEDQANSSSGILWVRQDPVVQQDETSPQQQTQQNGSADGAVHVKHAQHSDGMPSQPRIRFRHRRFHGHEISREALLDNVE